MSLKIDHGSRIEDLAKKALAELANDGRGPFEKSCVIVSNPLRAQWLRRCALLDGMSGRKTIFANVVFRTIDQFVAEAAAAIRQSGAPPPDVQTLALRIYALLSNGTLLNEKEMSIPREYLLLEGKIDVARAYALAQEIAKLFAKYQIYRLDMLRSWAANPKEELKSPDSVWQRALWVRIVREMKGRDEETIGDVLSRLDTLTGEDRTSALSRARQGYRSILVFDVPSLPNRYQEFLKALGEQEDVSIYQFRSAEGAKEDGFVPEPGVELELHGCYTPRRELEAIRNGLYDWFDKGQKRNGDGVPEGESSIRPRTALVLCADFANYAPSVEAVFGSDAEKGELKISGNGPSIPVKVVGRITKGPGALAETFTTLLNLPESRFACSELMNILEQPAVFTRFEFDEEDRRFVREMVQDGNIRWGYDDAHVRKILDLGADSTRVFPFTWRRGIDRMLLGALEGSVGVDGFGVVDVGAAESIKPNARIHGELARRAAKLDRFLETLNDLRNELPVSRTVDAWAGYLHGVVDGCFHRIDERSGRMIAAMNRAIETVTERLRGISWNVDDGRWPFALVRQAVVAELDAISLEAASKRTVANAVVFAPLSIGAAFPADMVWVCGMNNAAFPRKSSLRAFDLMGQAPEEDGDPSVRKDDRIAFREAVRCARKKLVLSYQYRNAKTNKSFPPSVLVEELQDSVGKRPRCEHRLHGFNAQYFTPESGLSSWSDEDYTAAFAAQNLRMHEDVEGVHAFSVSEEGATKDSPVEIDLDDFCAYCNDPDRFIKEHVLNAGQTGGSGALFADEEEFYRKPLDFTSLKGQWLTIDRVADLATQSRAMDDERIDRFVASLQEDGLIADDYDVTCTKEVLRAMWKDGNALRTEPLDILGKRTALAALSEQWRYPDYIEVKTPLVVLHGLLDGKGQTVHCRIVGQIPVVPGTRIHLQKALSGRPPWWGRVRLAVYRELVARFSVPVKLYEVRPGESPLVESECELATLYDGAPDFEERLYAGFGIQPSSKEKQEG